MKFTKRLAAAALAVVLSATSVPTVFGASNSAVNSPIWEDGKFIVMLDPGHGGKELGCTKEWSPYTEKEINLKIANSLKSELEKYKNVEVYMTRTTNDENPGLSQRIQMGADKHADVVVSLHINASSDELGKKRGSMVLVTNSHWKPENCKVRDMYNLEEDLGKSILAQLQKLGLGLSDDLGAKEGLLRRKSEVGSTYPNGDIADWYGIVKHGILKGVPSILVEHAYLDNKADYDAFLNTDEKINKLGVADAKGIADYYGLEKKAEEKPSKPAEKPEPKPSVKPAEKPEPKPAVKPAPEKSAQTVETVEKEAKKSPQTGEMGTKAAVGTLAVLSLAAVWLCRKNKKY